MAQCAVSGKDTFVHSYVTISESGEKPRKVFVRFDSLHKAHEVVGEDWREPFVVKWNPQRDLSLEDYRRLADNPRMRALPGLVRASVKREQLRAKLVQLSKARDQLLNP